MGFSSIRFHNFRNLRDRELEVSAHEVFLIGENGQGKTNLIEVIHFLCVASSFRENHELPLFRNPEEDIGLSGRYQDEESGSFGLSLRISQGKRKEIRCDEKPILDRKELFQKLLCICFVQQDMQFITGSPEDKRKFFDQTSILSDPTYLDTLRRYRRVLLSRNFALKTRRMDLLDAYDRQLSILGRDIVVKRQSLVDRFNEVFTPLIREVSGWGRSVRIAYSPSWKDPGSAEKISELLFSARPRDLAMGTTTTGPHRDNFTFIIDGGAFIPYASTGQMRLCALVLRVAQARFLTECTGKRPILLLDDVLLELDHGKRVSLLSQFPPYEQAFFTFLPDENYQPYRREETLLLTVQNGEFIL